MWTPISSTLFPFSSSSLTSFTGPIGQWLDIVQFASIFISQLNFLLVNTLLKLDFRHNAATIAYFFEVYKVKSLTLLPLEVFSFLSKTFYVVVQQIFFLKKIFIFRIWFFVKKSLCSAKDFFRKKTFIVSISLLHLVIIHWISQSIEQLF